MSPLHRDQGSSRTRGGVRDFKTVYIHLLLEQPIKEKKDGGKLGQLIDVNARNGSGWTALDIHSRIAESEDQNSEYRDIRKVLRESGVKRSDELFFPFDPYWQKKKKDTLMIVSSLMATMSFQVGINPPGGVWQDSSAEHEAGKAVIAYTNKKALNINFLWGDSPDKKKIHLVKWDEVCKSKDRGGLGIKKARNQNMAILTKLGWKISNQEEGGLWAAILRDKYLCNHSLQSWPKSRPASFIWKSIVDTKKVLEQGMKWIIGDGKSVHIWHDWWCGDKPLALAFPGEHVNSSQKVETLIVNGNWVLDDIAPYVDVQTLESINAIHIPVYTQSIDHPTWEGSGNGNFSISAAYEIINKDVPDLTGWKWFWKLKMPEKFKTFLWIILHNSLPTNLLRNRRGNFKLNTDGCWYESNGIGGFGGLFRSHAGDWIMGYHGRRSFNSSLEAELWSIYKGLGVIRDRKLENVKIESDSLVAVDLVTEGNPGNHPQSVLINEAHFLLAQTNTTIGHIPRAANQCADHLARMGAEHTEDLVFVMDMPIGMREFVIRDSLNLRQVLD
ncbi:hypothetical protein RHMOL_Rhmol01G0037200 [Rhododendron molle]|uniref:Uncharacterized protein n=1 Tax=Rhododendron molle TaxID=49168 RepID=A0ACC0PZA6_RHOML|nr:hypothetical protein RHMOL_Rhmol01G0037200 [Rhododendron molle]